MQEVEERRMARSAPLWSDVALVLDRFGNRRQHRAQLRASCATPFAGLAGSGAQHAAPACKTSLIACGRASSDRTRKIVSP